MFVVRAVSGDVEAPRIKFGYLYGCRGVCGGERGFGFTIGGHKGVSPGVLSLGGSGRCVSKHGVGNIQCSICTRSAYRKGDATLSQGAHSDLAEQLIRPTGVVNAIKYSTSDIPLAH